MSRTRILCNGCGFPLVYCKCPELKNCPFCGSEPMLYEHDIGDWIVICGDDNCPVCYCKDKHTKTTRQNAIKAWNTRTPPEEDDDICPNCEQPLMCGQDGLPFCFGCGYSNAPPEEEG